MNLDAHLNFSPDMRSVEDENDENCFNCLETSLFNVSKAVSKHEGSKKEIGDTS